MATPPNPKKLKDLEPLSGLIDYIDSTISTRMPGGKAKQRESELLERLRIDRNAMELTPGLFNTNVAHLVKNAPGIVTSARRADYRADAAVDQMSENLLALLDDLPDKFKVEASRWYEGANTIANSFAQKYGYDPKGVSAALAALSPSADWFMNVSNAERLLDTLNKVKGTSVTDEMIETINSIESMSKKKDIVSELKTGKPFEELSPKAQAMFVRAYDKSYNPQAYREVRPDGTFGDFMKTKTGELRTLIPQSEDNIVKALSVLNDPSLDNISEQMGGAHKVRSFYNNIVAPSDPFGSATIDTHQVGASLFSPVSQKSLPVGAAFGGAKGISNSLPTGVGGTYGLFQTAIDKAAEQIGALPRQIQSISWEAIRSIMDDRWKRNAKNVQFVDDEWRKFARGEQSMSQARANIIDKAGGIKLPSWFDQNVLLESMTSKSDSSFKAMLPLLTGGAITTAGVTASSDAEAKLTEDALRKALTYSIDAFKPAPGASKSSGPLDQGAGVKAMDNVFAILSAENPNALSFGDPENIARTQELGMDLINRYGEDAVSLGRGKYGNNERSFIVEGMPLMDALEYGKKYGQESVFTDRGLFYTDDKIGTHNPIMPYIDEATGAEDWRARVNPDAEDFYTEIATEAKPWADSQLMKFQYQLSDEVRKNPVPGESAPSTTLGVHYGTTPNLNKLSPSYMGTGAAGAEMNRVAAGAPQRTNFYQLENILSDVVPKPEATVAARGKNLYGAKLENVYDLTTDPLDINKISKNPTEMEANLKSLGYSGYSTKTLEDVATNRGGSVVMFDDVPVQQLDKGGKIRLGALTGLLPALTKAEEEEPAGTDILGLLNVKRDRAEIDRNSQLAAKAAGAKVQHDPRSYPMSTGTIESADFPLLQDASMALRQAKTPWSEKLDRTSYIGRDQGEYAGGILGLPFEATANVADRWAYGDSADALDLAFMPVEALGAGALLKPGKGLLGAFDAENRLKASYLEMLLREAQNGVR